MSYSSSEPGDRPTICGRPRSHSDPCRKSSRFFHVDNNRDETETQALESPPLQAGLPSRWFKGDWDGCNGKDTTFCKVVLSKLQHWENDAKLRCKERLGCEMALVTEAKYFNHALYFTKNNPPSFAVGSSSSGFSFGVSSEKSDEQESGSSATTFHANMRTSVPKLYIEYFPALMFQPTQTIHFSSKSDKPAPFSFEQATLAPRHNNPRGITFQSDLKKSVDALSEDSVFESGESKNLLDEEDNIPRKAPVSVSGTSLATRSELASRAKLGRRRQAQKNGPFAPPKQFYRSPFDSDEDENNCDDMPLLPPSLSTDLKNISQVLLSWNDNFRLSSIKNALEGSWEEGSSIRQARMALSIIAIVWKQKSAETKVW